MRRKDFTQERGYKIPERNVVYFNTQKRLDFTDVVDGQVFLVSEKVKRVFEMYERQVSYKFFCLLNNLTGKYMVYFAPIFPTVNCMEKESRPREGEVILVEETIGWNSVFRVECEKEIVVARLDVAESLLRRNVEGMEFIRISFIGGRRVRQNGKK